MTARLNIALVVLDTLRKDSFDEHFRWLVESGVSFDNAWSTSHWTPPAHASLFTGLYASEVGTNAKNRSLSCPEDTLAEILSAAGYQTRGYSANPNHHHQFNFDRGFDEFECFKSKSWATYVNDQLSKPWRYINFLKELALNGEDRIKTLLEAIRHKSSKQTYSVEQIQRVLQQQEFNSKEFFFCNLMEAHSPYEAPDGFRSLDPIHPHPFKSTALDSPNYDTDRIRQPYEDCVRFLSAEYREIHAELKSNFDIIITLSDHGEAFGEYGAWGHTCVLPPQIGKIPLVISGPKSDDIHQTEQPVSLLDVFQTICDLADIEVPVGTRGRSLRDEMPAERAVMLETHGLTPGLVDLLASIEGGSEIESDYDQKRFAVATKDGYAFQTVEGGLEIVGSIDEAEKRIKQIRNTLSKPSKTPEHETVPADIQDQLENLGYAV